MTFKAIVRRLATAFGVAALATGCAAAPRTQPAALPAAHPALWEVSDADTRLYLFGTIHLLPKDYAWRTARFDQAMAGSQGLIVETIIDEQHPQALAGVLAQLGFSNSLPPIAERVAPDKRAQLEKAIAKSGAPRAAFDKMESWAAAFILLGNQFTELGLNGGSGVESTLRGSFTQAHKPIGQLETNAEQLGFFDTLPENAQRQLLEGAIDAPADMRESFHGMLAAWARGDVRQIATTFNQDLSASPELVDALLKRRNANWSRWIAHRMTMPGTAMIAVGAGHLAGKGSVIDLLKRGGYRVRRVQ